MRKKPTYDWEWFTSHTPFKKILTETCELEIEKEIYRIYVFAGIWQPANYYSIKINYPLFEANFEKIKNLLLNTNVCKKNKDVFDYVNAMTCNKRELCSLVHDSCMKNPTGTFHWDWCE